MSPERTASRTSRLLDGLLWTAAIAALALTASFSLERAAPHLQELIGSDKAGHAVAYFAVLLPLLFAAVWRPGRGDGVMPNGQLRLAIGLVAIGALMEVLQGDPHHHQGPGVVAMWWPTGSVSAVPSSSSSWFAGRTAWAPTCEGRRRSPSPGPEWSVRVG